MLSRERLRPTRPSLALAVALSLAACGDVRISYGAYDREGVFDVRVETRPGEILQWSNVRVAGDRCGPVTVVLQAALTLYD